LVQRIALLAKEDKQTQGLAAERRSYQQSVREQVREGVKEAVSMALERILGDEVFALLGRRKGQRRDLADVTCVNATCNGCGSSIRRDFYRAGSYGRSLLTGPAYVDIRVPRLSCVCGGTVQLRFTLFAPYERVWFDLRERARQLAGLCLSLRDSVEVLAAENGQPLAIGTINGLVNETAALAEAFRSGPLAEVPAVVVLDGVWTKLLVETEREYTDKRGRRRRRKRRRKVPVLVAYGIDPRTGEKRLLDWEQGQEEDRESWQRLLERLERRGLRAEKGLRLFIHDGSAGLEAAFEEVHFGEGVRRQRCVFHKLRNVAKAVQGAEGMSRKEKRVRREEVLRAAAAVYGGKDRVEIEGRLKSFAEEWREREPEAVLTLQRGFEATLAYLDVQAEARERGEEWAACYLRTTSALERVNRALRQKFRQVVIFHSEKGLQAAVHLVIAHRGLAGVSDQCWFEAVEEALMAA
jgi:transposase-like protein